MSAIAWKSLKSGSFLTGVCGKWSVFRVAAVSRGAHPHSRADPIDCDPPCQSLIYEIAPNPGSNATSHGHGCPGIRIFRGQEALSRRVGSGRSGAEAQAL